MLLPNRETYVDKIVEVVEGRILSGDILPETKISETKLAKEFGVSRGPAREALNRLEDMGLIEKNAFTRTVKAFDKGEYKETYELRIVVEAYCAGLAAVNSTEEDHRVINDIVNRMEHNLGVDKRDILRKLVLEFHDYIVYCSHNRVMTQVYDITAKKIRWANAVVLKLRDQKIDFDEHRRIAELITQRKAREVRDLMEHHTAANMELVLTEFEKRNAT